ncbi:MAG: amylo-alpha-1,6-glucosidase [Nitrososphaerales archaeon]
MDNQEQGIERDELESSTEERMLHIAETGELESSYHWVDSKNLVNSFTLVGKNTYAIGLESGKFTGRWNGIWSLPIKIADSVHFALSDGSSLRFLNDYASQFVTKLSHVERAYEIPEIGVRVRELMFIPENRQSICWRFIIKCIDSKKTLRRFKLLAICEFNLMWEVKQAGEQFKVRKEILLYNQDNFSVIAKHYRHPDWIGIFGANRSPRKTHLGWTDLRSLPEQSEFQRTDKPSYGGVALEYDLEDEGINGQRFDIDFCLTGGSLSYLEAFREFNDTILNLEPLVLEKATLYQNYLANTAEIMNPEDSFARAFKWSKINLHMLEHYQAGFGTGTFAGLPHFAIYFGRDICWSTYGQLAVGDFDGARENLNLLARFQAPSNGEDMLREPYYRGEVAHEIRTEGTTYYYSADATPLFVIAARNYLDWTKDTNFVKFIYNNIISAVEWSIDADRDGDGLAEHGPEGFLIDTTWMDSYYRGKSALDVQATTCKALYDGARIASILGDDSRAADWHGKASRMNSLILDRYWNEAENFFYDTIENNGSLNDSITINSVVPLLFDLADQDKILKVLSRIESPEFMTDWGVRTRSNKDREYDPRSYQKGGVWPFCTGWVALTEFKLGMYKEGLATIGRFVKGLDMGSNYFKEVLFGDMPPTGQHPVQPTGCFIQAWSAGMFLSSMIQGLLGISPRESEGNDLAMNILPFVTGEWNDLFVKSIRVAENRFDFGLKADGHEVRIKILNHGPETTTVNSGFVLPSRNSLLKTIDGSESMIEELSQTNASGYLKALFKLKLMENESKEIAFATYS